jgi:hypothetical protein
MRTFIVELIKEGIELGLLLQDVLTSWSRGLFFNASGACARAGRSAADDQAECALTACGKRPNKRSRIFRAPRVTNQRWCPHDLRRP